MKLRPLTNASSSIVPARGGELALAVTAELCQRAQKNQPQWLAPSPSGSTSLASSLIFFPAARFMHLSFPHMHLSFPQLHYSISK